MDSGIYTIFEDVLNEMEARKAEEKSLADAIKRRLDEREKANNPAHVPEEELKDDHCADAVL